jgi:N-acetylmuramic acid 6-phosphate etherase
MGTESRNPRSYGLDKMSAREVVRLMNEEEHAVFRIMTASEEAIAVAIEHAAKAFREGGRIFYIGSGTSGRIATADAAEMPPTFGIDPEHFVAVVSGGSVATSQAVEDAEDDPVASIQALNLMGLNPKDIVIGIAASGTTPFVLSAIKHARQKGVWTCGIANNKGTPVLAEAEHAILLDTGPEILTGSTRLKAGTAQKMCLNRISTGAMVLNGKVIENLMVDVKAKNIKLRDRCIRIVCELSTATRDEAQEALEASEWSIRYALDRLRP